MAKLKEQTATFERFALEASIREHPGCGTAQRALLDWLLEHGYSNIGARREVAKLVRIATDEYLARELRREMERHPVLKIQIADLCLPAAGGIRIRMYSLSIEAGATAPCWQPVSYAYEDPQGNQYTLVSSEQQVENDIRYVPTGWICRVGANWVRMRLPRSAEQIEATQLSGRLAI